jgi:phospholipid/cholesterol/gamma-HCH transport system substrate-binding protein
VNEKDYDSIQRKRNFIVGIFVLVALTALVWLIFKFGQMPVIVSKLGSYAVIAQFASAPGVQDNTPVKFCGYQVGRVTEVAAPELLNDVDTGLKYYQVKITMRVDNRYRTIPSTARIMLMKRGLGSSYIEIVVDPTKPLVARDPNRPDTVYLTDNVLVEGYVSTASEFLSDETQKKVDDLLKGVTALVSNLNTVVGDQQNQENFRQTLAHLKDATAQADQTLKQIEAFSKAGSKSADQLTDSLAKLSGSISELELVLHKINDGQGTAGRLVNDASLYESLVESSKDLDSLIVEMKLFTAKAREGGVPIKLK